MSQRSKCILHKTATALHFTEGKTSVVGIRKRTSTFPKYCEEQQRLKRCKYEPKCEETHNCLRNSYICMISYIVSYELYHIARNLLVHSLSSNGYHAGYVKDIFGCTKRPCECAGFEIKDKTIIGTDCSYDETDFHPLRNILEPNDRESRLTARSK